MSALHSLAAKPARNACRGDDLGQKMWLTSFEICEIIVQQKCMTGGEIKETTCTYTSSAFSALASWKTKLEKERSQ